MIVYVPSFLLLMMDQTFFLTFLQKLLKVLGEKFSAGLKGPTE